MEMLKVVKMSMPWPLEPTITIFDLLHHTISTSDCNNKLYLENELEIVFFFRKSIHFKLRTFETYSPCICTCK